MPLTRHATHSPWERSWPTTAPNAGRPKTRSLDEILRDAEYLDRSIAAEVALLARIEDEHNAHTAGTWEHAQRALVSA